MEKTIKSICYLFEQRYGVPLNIEFVSHMKPADPLPGLRAPFIYSRSLRQVSFSFFDGEKKLKVMAVASPVDNQDAIVFGEMAQFLQLTLGESLLVHEQKALKEGTLEHLERLGAKKGKVVPFHRGKKSRSPGFQFKKPQLKPDIQPIWIAGGKEALNIQIALSIHECVGHWAFINAAEIPDLMWQDPHAWKQFPQVTIFIPHIGDLSPDQVSKLKASLEMFEKYQDQKPLIIATGPVEIPAPLESLKGHFKYYEAKEKLKPKAQAHLLLYHYAKLRKNQWVHQSTEDNLYFMPFSPVPKDWH